MSSIGSSWKDDAIVDTCKKTQVVTETQQIREIYLQIFEKEDIPFEEKFSLKMYIRHTDRWACLALPSSK